MVEEEEDQDDGDLADGLDTCRIPDGDSNPEAVDAEGVVRSPCRRAELESRKLGIVVDVVGPGFSNRKD